MFKLFRDKWWSFKSGLVFSRNVLAMGVVSFFNDIASEMIYPIIPIFLTSALGAPATVVGLIEGISESTASFFKVISGWLSDRLKKRKAFVVFGYALSSLAKALLSLASTWPFVLLTRFMDRFGKGARTAARDVLILESVSREDRGKAFGLHRAMDTLGAVIGPLIALGLMFWLHNDFRRIFLIAFIPAFIGVLVLIFFVRETKRPVAIPAIPQALPVKLRWSDLDLRFRIFLMISVLFSIGNSSDAFLILRAQNLGLSIGLTVATYVCFNIVYSIMSLPVGILTDKIGPRKILGWGFFLFAFVYFGFGLISSSALVWVLFPLYGLYMAMTDGISKVYIAKMVPIEKSGTAFGAYQTIIGLCAFLASLLAGWLWKDISPSAPFIFGGALALLAALLFVAIRPEQIKVK